MISTVLRKKFRRVHIPRKIKRFKFYSKAPSIWFRYFAAKNMISAETVACANRLFLEGNKTVRQ